MTRYSAAWIRPSASSAKNMRLASCATQAFSMQRKSSRRNGSLRTDFPPWGTIYRWFATFRDDGRFERGCPTCAEIHRAIHSRPVII